MSNSVQIVRPGMEVETTKFDWQINDAYVAEISHFLECARTGAAPKFTLDSAILTLRVTLAAREAAEQRKWVSFA
jgi:predicted dehydrogenase